MMKEKPDASFVLFQRLNVDGSKESIQPYK